MNNSRNKLTGAALAIAAASLFTTTALTSGLVSAKSAEVQCWGVNTCKGHNDCKTASNDCKGMGSCKGQGFLKMDKDLCANLGGTVK
ncbi:hypothetical protein [Gynuella sunshinyii]|uniref:Integral membrane protein n=1 Tax=Gynuella sunshinyii YC6258 TaxID=1445510 RepID=A0A0C5VTE8_9GAMM|nr:hypothetical protein [Gynuella sunshinyii]AJQ96588.1 hypothetical Protein YC6258_04556 [Gynuella sunshinyii YC6258]